MTALAHIGGPVGGLGLMVLLLGTSRQVRLVGLGGWAVGCGALALWLAPAGHHRAYAAAAVGGVVAGGLLAWLFHKIPWSFAVAVLACAPARIPVSVGDTKANLLLPLYLVVAAAALALAWDLFGEDSRVRELGPLAWPVALFTGWTSLTFLWSVDRRQGAIYLLFFVLPFGLLAIAVARLPWLIGWVKGLYAQLAAMAFIFGAIGAWQYWTRNIYWNPKVKVDNAYAPSSWFYRVNSVFYDPSIYGRFLVLGILASLVLVLYSRGAVVWAAAALAIATWVGLVPSFSQSSFIALGAGIVVALLLLWRRKAVLPLAVAAALLAAVTFGVPQVRHRIVGNASLSHVTSGRSKLISGGVKLAVHHPVIGVGAGGFKRAYADQAGLKGKEPKAAASHDAAVTVAAETGLPGLALLVWLVALGLGLAVRRNPVATADGRARLAFGLALLAIVVHSLFYNALVEDPLFWALLALSALAWREQRA